MIRSRAISGAEIRLTDERWAHIESRHPEMFDQHKKIAETLADPDMVQEGDSGEMIAVKHYERTPLTSKFMAVVYRESEAGDGFVVTAYFTSRPSARRSVLWLRPTS